jgi:hypothetical protein
MEARGVRLEQEEEWILCRIGLKGTAESDGSDGSLLIWPRSLVLASKHAFPEAQPLRE